MNVAHTKALSGLLSMNWEKKWKLPGNLLSFAKQGSHTFFSS